MIGKIWGFVFSLVILFSSCSSVYMPNVPNSPMLSAPGELHASGHITPKGNVSFNTAYAVSEHFGVLANGSLMNRNKFKKDFRHNLMEIGGGYFNTFGPDSNLRIFEIYTGIGKGSSDRTFKERATDGFVTYDRQEVTFDKFFIQANYSSKEKKSISVFKKRYPLNYGTVLRLSYVTMDEFIRNDIPQPTEDNIFLEPVFFTRMVLSPSVQFQFTSGSNFGLRNRKFLTAGNSVFSQGYGWVVKTAYVDYKRALGLGEEFSVTTGIETINPKGCRVQFSITSKKTGKICCDGWFDYVMIDINTGRGAKVSEEIIKKYSV